ncbi:DUF4347 domain-containing protein [Phormidium sp. LEGE 05292]|uniref:DUF4347 domain-containing protein n=1 Tax=[Phormidium] sp. LEGE 05292 TaxID=767427 RepID=UPI00187F1BB3|nr:DUF4347 domain-containing protein [Phormidium sp. LEGE 05292]MBE9226175.1 DUF4347 domain-containing protein [Phormidium sp. LEGE 05292]
MNNEFVANRHNAIVVIDAAVADYQTLVAGVDGTYEVIVLDPAKDGIYQITEILGSRSEVSAVHIVCHGAPGCLYLGNAQLNLDTLKDYGLQWQSWKSTQYDRTLLLYGCNVAAGDAGEEFIQKLHQLTGANIAATRTLTGNSAKGGNWDLEVKIGQANSLLAFQPSVTASYPGILAIGISLAISPSSVTEDGATNLVYTFNRTGDLSTTLTVNFNVGGNAIYNTDYTVSSGNNFQFDSNTGIGNVTFAAGSDTATLTITPTKDTDVEPDETVELSLISSNNYNVVTSEPVKGTITNDDQPPVLKLNLNSTVDYFTGSTPTIVASPLTITDPDGANLDEASVVISTNFNASQDSLSISGQTGTSGVVDGLTWKYNNITGVMTLKGSASVDTYQDALRKVTYSNSSNTPTKLPRSIQFTLGSNLANPVNGHFYDFIDAPAINWNIARSVANSKTLFGLKGYLVTITSESENSFVSSKLQGQGWMGANDSVQEGEWRWVTGPEAGTLFWQGLSNGSAVNGSYTNWQLGEPNNYGVNPGEDYAHFLPTGKWNDYAANNTNMNGYVVEYGGMPGDPTLQITGIATVNLKLNNTAPSLTGNATLAPVDEDTANPPGQTISNLFSGKISDPDLGASLSGVAIVSNTASSTQGKWQYSTNNGTNWYDIGTVGDGSTALALSASSLLRFVPASNYNGTPTALSVRALDDSYTAGFTNNATPINVNTSTNGGTTAISASTSTIDTTITPVNDPPTVANPIANQSATKGSAFSFTVPENTFKDVDIGDTLSYTATLDDGNQLPSWLIFDATTRTFSGTPTNNENVGNLSIKVTAKDTSNATASNSFVLAIANSNNTPSVISINDVTQSEENNGTTNFNFTVSLNNASSQPITVNYTTQDGTATTADNDYTSNSGVLTFAAGETQKSISVAVNGDTKSEADETFEVKLSNPTNATIADETGVGTIKNDDQLPAQLSAISISNAIAQNEGNGGTVTHTFEVSLSNASSQPITFDYSTSDGTATFADGDYNSSSGTLSFTPGETKKTIAITSLGDYKYEPNETFNLNLSNPINATIANGTAVGTINNDDSLPGIAIADVIQNEGDSGTTNFNFVVTLSNPSYQPVKVNYATTDGISIAGKDYNSAVGVLTFNPGEIFKNISVAVNGNTVVETNKNFLVNLYNLLNGTVISNRAVGTIVNDDTSVVDTNINKTGKENTLTTFSPTDFTNSNNKFSKIKIVSLPNNGILLLGNSNVTLNQEIPFAELINLRFIPATGWSGTTSFNWRGFDGANYTTADTTVNLRINPVNNTPVGNLGVSDQNGTVDCFCDEIIHPDVNNLPGVSAELNATEQVRSINDDNNLLFGTNSNDLLQGSADEDLLLGTAGDDNLLGGKENDLIFGSKGRDWICVNKGNDFANGNEDDDFVNGNQGDDTVRGGQGNDFVRGGQGNDLLFGDRGNDTLAGDKGNDTVFGGGSDAFSDNERDLIFGGSGDDLLHGNTGNDSLFGEDGNDTIYAGKDDDIACGDAGDDLLFGDLGNDSLCGNDGNDTIFGGIGGNNGNDTASDDDDICGGAGNDLLFGNQGADWINGELGDDTLYGGKGDDTLIGGDGNDLLSGDVGNDSLMGGNGSDKFVLVVGQGSDVITDFQDGVDSLVLLGNLTFPQLSIVQSGNNTLISLTSNNQLLATLNGISANLITQQDFIFLT